MSKKMRADIEGNSHIVMENIPNNEDLQTSHPQRVKRSHRKSRSGCLVCKQRRVKCDEARPHCAKCRLRGLKCAYLTKYTHVLSESSRAQPIQTKNVASSDLPFPLSPFAEHSQCPAGVTETELIRHYLTHTMQTIVSTTDRNEMSDMWRIIIPTLAYTSAPVWHGMLTLAAICLHFHDCPSGLAAAHSPYREAAEAYGETFVAESRQQLERLEPSEINITLACSRLLCVLGFAFYRIHRSNGVTLADEAGWRWLHLLRGVVTAAKTARESGGIIDPLIAADMIGVRLPTGQIFDPPSENGSMAFEHPLLSFILHSQSDRFSALHTALNKTRHVYTDETYHDLSEAIESLRETTQSVRTGRAHSLTRTIYAWAVHVSKDFVEMLEHRRALALAIYSHWLILVILLEDRWWIDDMGRAGIQEILGFCSGCSWEISALLEWPRQALDFEILTMDHIMSPTVVRIT